MDRHRLLSQQIIKLPHKQDGTINYTVLGNMITATILGEVLEVSFIDREFGRPQDQQLPDTESEWEFMHKENDVTVYKKKQLNSKTHSFLGRGVIEAPFQTVVDYIHKLQSRLDWDDFLMDNKYVQTGVSIEDKDYPHRPPYIRGEVLEGSGWVVEKYGASECSTLLTYVVNMDLKELPSGLMDKVLRRQPMAIHHIRKKFTAHTSMELPIPSTPPPPSSQVDDDSDKGAEDDDYSIPFEDTVPINHYTTTKKDNEPIYADPDPMYPWVTDRKAMAERKLSREQGTHYYDKVSLCTSRYARTSINGGKYDKPSAWLSRKDNKELDKTATETTSTSPSLNDDDEPDELLYDVSKSNAEGDKEGQSVLPRKEFPSFSAWCKDE